MKYYSLIGDDEISYGLLRKSGFEVERFDLTERVWKILPDGMRHFNGDNNDAVPLSQATANQIVENLQK